MHTPGVSGAHNLILTMLLKLPPRTYFEKKLPLEIIASLAGVTGLVFGAELPPPFNLIPLKVPDILLLLVIWDTWVVI